MSLRFSPTQQKDVRNDPRLRVRRHTGAMLAVDDEDIATQFPATLLITAPTQERVETLARRVHGGGPRKPFPFIHVSARELPVEREVLKEYCVSLLTAAAGGSILINNVEDMQPVVQDTLVELLGSPELTRDVSAEVRLISGTTVPLLDRVAAGAFSDRLFYRLNTIHVTVRDDRGGVAHTTR